MLPHPQDPVSITAVAGSNSTLSIPFRNPLDIPVFVDVYLSGNLLRFILYTLDNGFCMNVDLSIVFLNVQDKYDNTSDIFLNGKETLKYGIEGWPSQGCQVLRV